MFSNRQRDCLLFLSDNYQQVFILILADHRLTDLIIRFIAFICESWRSRFIGVIKCEVVSSPCEKYTFQICRTKLSNIRQVLLLILVTGLDNMYRLDICVENVCMRPSVESADVNIYYWRCICVPLLLIIGEVLLSFFTVWQFSQHLN